MTNTEAIRQENERRWIEWQKAFFAAIRAGHDDPWLRADRIRPQRQAKTRNVQGAK